MHAIEFVNQFAYRIGRDSKSIRVVDRALAEAGLRKTSAGKKFPDVTIEEAILLIFAMLSGFPATRAAEGARKLSGFHYSKGFQRNPAILAKVLKISAPQLMKLTLLEVFALLCIRHARGDIDRDAPGVHLEVNDGDLAKFSIGLHSNLAEACEVTFGGAELGGGEGEYYESRGLYPGLLRWMTKKVVFPEVALMPKAPSLTALSSLTFNL